MRARTEVMDTYRRFPTLDPQLPAAAAARRVAARPAREMFAAVYDGLADTAERHVRAVVARFADGAHAGIRAHTIADLLAGVCAAESRSPAPPAGSTDLAESSPSH